MPNHVINEVVFHDVSAEQRAAILAKVSSPNAAVDFEVLLPIPLNLWWWSAGTRHEEAFPGTALDWCRRNWSTKWNAYGLQDGEYEPVVQTEDTLTITFQTAWSPPRGWLCALFNSVGISFAYRFLDEGDDKAFVGTFAVDSGGIVGAQWEEVVADDPTYRRLHKLFWGVEEFEDEPSPTPNNQMAGGRVK